MDDTPKAFFEELRSGLLKKRVGQIALAVVLAQAVWRLMSSLVWYLIIPVIGRSLEGHTESVLFESAAQRPFPWEALFGSLLEFVLTVVVVFYLNRWIHNKPREDRAAEITSAENQLNGANEELKHSSPTIEEPEVLYNLVGERVGSEEEKKA